MNQYVIQKFDEEQNTLNLKISLHKLLINYKGTNNNLTVEKVRGHHLNQGANETDDHQGAPVRTHRETHRHLCGTPAKAHNMKEP